MFHWVNYKKENERLTDILESIKSRAGFALFEPSEADELRIAMESIKDLADMGLRQDDGVERAAVARTIV